MKKIFYCVHHITVDKDGYIETVAPCSSKETAKKVARAYTAYTGGKTYICTEEKEVEN